MGYAREECFSPTWRDEYKGSADPTLFEKAVHALELVAMLKRSELPFLFKGGTALLLLLSTMKRLSIDVDIVTNVEKEAVEHALDFCCREGRFTGFEEDVRKSPIPKGHYKVFFETEIGLGSGDILLDVVFEDPGYSTEEKLLKTPFFEPEGDTDTVNVPTPAAFLADKLHVIPPYTTGIPIEKEQELQRIKQLYDIRVLFDECHDFDQLDDAYRKCLAQQNRFLSSSYTIEEVVQDTVEFAKEVATIQLGTGQPTERQREILSKTQALNNYLLA